MNLHGIHCEPVEMGRTQTLEPTCYNLPSGKLTWQWNIPPFLIGNTSSVRVHFPASCAS